MTKMKLHYLLLIFLVSILAGCNDGAAIRDFDGAAFADRIAFFSDRDKDQKVFLVSPDGKEQKVIRFNLTADVRISNLTWSNTLQKWAFSGEINGFADIYIASADGQTIQNITNTESIYEDEPTISPDGKYIAFVTAEESRNTSIVISRLDGTALKKISKYPMFEITPTWFKDSQNILMISSKEGSPNIFKVRLDGSGLTNISQGKGQDSDFSLAENNEIVAYVSDRAGGKKIFVYEFVTGKITQLTNDSDGLPVGPIVSPDGSKVIFRSDKGGDVDLYIVEVSDKTVKKITNTPKVMELSYHWSYDGSNVVYSADANGQLDVFIISLDGTKVVNVTNHPSNDYRPLWIRVRQ